MFDRKSENVRKVTLQSVSSLSSLLHNLNYTSINHKRNPPPQSSCQYNCQSLPFISKLMLHSCRNLKVCIDLYPPLALGLQKIQLGQGLPVSLLKMQLKAERAMMRHLYHSLLNCSV